ncbi:MAG TPA: bifunctional glutamate N-acetyltransferase/amino-acid acetyltransferase ArgJ [Candidatus Omnitrophota bacterium]|nr:bifunctional glutamate N-acetyltransferase/amino-acid acetyltransferase ArgJ [Candidatus Omnitrophota bacterium]HPT06559.1 bifunctional glutamate N-acetyltransferase/amino-acid acetyltransferase ArgJ [Candidatus Omnitrophota bacterium]
MNVVKKAILPTGFVAAGIPAGIKKNGKLDVALIVSQSPALAAVVSTSNTMQAAPVILNKAHLKKSSAFYAIIANSGNANAFTGKAGLKDADTMATEVGFALSIKKESVLVASTGIISKRMPITRIKNIVPQLVLALSRQGIAQAKQAIMTTDKFAKEITVSFKVGTKTVTVCGIAKGAGMISPKMATMLAFITTDANISKHALDRALHEAVAPTFNSMTVDGCMSTNDTVIVLANRRAGNSQIDGGAGFKKFVEALKIVCMELAKMIVRDGEGSTKLIRITVMQAKHHEEAKLVAMAVANYNLFKIAMFASSPNMYGRIVAAVGSTGVPVREEELKIKYSPLQKNEVDITVRLGRGKARAVVYTSDLSHEYVKINAEYN